jgi:hypothetical protein
VLKSLDLLLSLDRLPTTTLEQLAELRVLPAERLRIRLARFPELGG